MITSISKLKHFGVFQDYKPSNNNLKPFCQYNLFYGWNGSGKSTLAKLFLSINDRRIHSDFETGEFQVLIDDCPDITHKTIDSNTINIRVFNKDFIERNVNFNESKAKSILILSEERKDELEKYKIVSADYSIRKEMLDKESKVLEENKASLLKDLTKWASSIKKSFELIETANSYYLNYDRKKLGDFIKTNKAIISKETILEQEKVIELKNSIRPDKKVDISIEQFEPINSESLIINTTLLQKLLSKNIFSNQIEKLVENSNLNKWVQEGLIIHRELKSVECEFCNQKLPENKINELSNHFSQDYTELMNDLGELDLYIQKLNIDLNKPYSEVIDYYTEFQPEYIQARLIHNSNSARCIEKLVELVEQIEKKTDNPFTTFEYEVKDIEVISDCLNDSIRTLKSITLKHNSKNQEFDTVVKKCQDLLELHFVSEKLIQEKYFEIEKQITKKQATLDEENETLSKLLTEVKAYEAMLLNEVVGADNFNHSLERFLGRNDIKLEFDKVLKGYKIVRGKSTSAAINLSEGERTAIAFIYFISKLKENSNSISETIIVLDDPISSFDSNHLFHSYSYLKFECEKAKQLFILTHNFQYFKLLRDWLKKKNDKKKQPDGTEKTRSRFYTIECTTDGDRHAKILDANDTLLKYNSEYHYIFSKLYEFKDLNELNIEKAFLIANLSRKLLESFLSFKFPKGRNDFAQLMEAGCDNVELREKVYRFINKYSHNMQIDFYDSHIDNMLSEGNNIINDVFAIINSKDESHYKEMSELVSNLN